MGSPIYWWRTSFGEDELAKIGESMLAEHISQGPVTAEFEEKFAAALDVPYAVATTSGSTALLMGLMVAGVGPGDEVIVPNRTFVATAHAALLLGASVVLVDVIEDHPAMDVSQIESKITPRTKAIMPVHLNGRSVDMTALEEVASRHGLWIVEDACQAIFSCNEYGYLGTQSNVGCFSLGVTKLISTGQGGVAVTSDRDTYDALRLMRTHGVTDTFGGEFNQLGLNFRMTDIAASIGLVHLGQVESRRDHVKAVQARYSAALHEMPFIDLLPVNEAAGEIPVYVEAMCEERDRLVAWLEERGIQARPLLPDLDRSQHLSASGEFPRSRKFGAQGLYLPGGPAQSLENVDRVIAALSEFGNTL
jgi:perosamine synthetase